MRDTIVRAIVGMVVACAFMLGGCTCTGQRIFLASERARLVLEPPEPPAVADLAVLPAESFVMWGGIWDGVLHSSSDGTDSHELRCRHVRLTPRARSMVADVGLYQALRLPESEVEETSQRFRVSVQGPLEPSWWRRIYSDRIVAWTGIVLLSNGGDGPVLRSTHPPIQIETVAVGDAAEIVPRETGGE